jgi:hypothetical protein
MSKREQRRAARRDARAARQERRQAARSNRQKNRQGFLTNIVGEGGLGSLAEKVFAGPTDDLPMGGGKTEDENGKDNTMTYLLVGLGAYLLMNKKK